MGVRKKGIGKKGSTTRKKWVGGGIWRQEAG